MNQAQLSRTTFTVFTFLLFPTELFAQNAQPKPSLCKALQGEWVGDKVGGTGYIGPIKIQFNNDCTYSWFGTRGKVTDGRLAMEGNDIRYENTAGSKGRAVKKGNKLQWNNIYTGNNYTVKVTKK